MRDLVYRYLEGGLSRRGFLNGMARAGFTAAAAKTALAPLAAAGAAATVDPGARPITGTGGELVLAQARAAGAEYLFANPGSMEVGFYDALLDVPDMHLIMGLHEGIVISMADGYHHVSGKPAFVNIHVAAGTAQASGQLYNASRDGSALVITAGLNDNELYNDDIILAPRPGFDQRDLVRQFTKISHEARSAESLPLMVRRAFKVATTEPGGPVYVAMAHYALEKKNVKADILPAERFMIRGRMRPDKAAVEEAARLLVESKEPLLLVGDDVWKSGAQHQLLAFAEKFGLAVSGGPGGMAYRSFPVHHPQWIGQYSVRSAWMKRNQDLLLMVGCRNDFGGRTLPDGPETPAGARIVRIGFDTNPMGRTTATDLAVLGDVRESLQDLMDAVESRLAKSRLRSTAQSRAQEVRGYTSDIRKKAEETARGNSGHSPIHPAEVGAVMARTLDRNAIVVSENLTGIYDSFPFGPREDEPMWVANSGNGLGWGIGAATGAKLAAPDRQVVCSIGDGSVMYSAAGFWTQVRFSVPVLTVVWNNRNYQTVRHAYHAYNGKMVASNRYVGMHLGDPDIDFVKLAESQGVHGVKVTTPSELEPALRKGIAATRDGKPFLVDVATACYGGGAESTWFERFSLADKRKQKV
jgi:benzoylformate decarboxylase